MTRCVCWGGCGCGCGWHDTCVLCHICVVSHVCCVTRHKNSSHRMFFTLHPPRKQYIIVGSANINNRSLTGQRDTEIAVACTCDGRVCVHMHAAIPPGCFPHPYTIEFPCLSTTHTPPTGYQPGYTTRTATPPNLPRGHVHGFRMFLWREHTGGSVDPCFYQPHTAACARHMRQMAEANWAAYTGVQAVPLPHGHLLPYPVHVGQDGSVNPLPGWECLPDTRAAVQGKDGMLPDFLTG